MNTRVADARCPPSPWRGGGRLLAVALSLLLLAAAQQGAVGEYEVMAAYLYNFGKFVKWPPDGGGTPAASTFTVCVLGRDPFGQKLDEVVRGEAIAGLAAAARRIKSVEESAGCRILFVSLSEERGIDKLLPKIADRPLLTVSDIPEFAKGGGMIGFVVRQRRVRFEVNLEAVRRSGLDLSSELLKVASVIDPKHAKDPS